MNGRVAGTVKWFNEKKGFGFIRGSQGHQDVFVHYSALEGDGFKTLTAGETVEYEITMWAKGAQAIAVTKLPAPAGSVRER